jgi:hypothetical protein
MAFGRKKLIELPSDVQVAPVESGGAWTVTFENEDAEATATAARPAMMKE